MPVLRWTWRLTSRAPTPCCWTFEGVSDFPGYFVVTTVESRRQMRSLTEDIEHALEGRGAVLHHREGSGRSGWVLLDFGDVVVHLFGPEEREYYGIEEVWKRGVEIVRIQ